MTDPVAALARKWCWQHATALHPDAACDCDRIAAAVREALETEAQWACPLCHCCGEKRHDGDDPCVSCAATRNEALEMAEKAICPLCKDGELIDTDGGHGDDEEWAPCPAEPIAALRERQG